MGKWNAPLIAICICLLFCIQSLAQPNDRSAAEKLFTSGDYRKAVPILKKVVKSDDRDVEAWYMLGAAYLKTQKYKDAIKALKKAVELAPKNDVYLALLAYCQMMVSDADATKTANETLRINPQNAEAYYVLGILSYRNESFAGAYDRARRAIELKPDFSPAYRLKAQALIASYMALPGKVLPPATRGDLLIEAVADLDKFLALTQDASQRREVEAELVTLRHFAEYYGRPENQLQRGASLADPPDPTRTALRILSKPRPGYTDGARARRISGRIVVLVTFGADGKIGPVMVTQSLDPDLDQQAVRAARGIKFVPATQNGVPVASVRQVEYSFMIF